ncbi:hypothetical protein BLNAU_11842 [Blattamonas nauphoetae]|uniref:Uncharacterized protein n=1 Tax=Blattamonas nauphoetae TaxID=2049346 RepID=A0ABQ9XRV3_9EUKA|nr:hypothetical protein BLNAU_11842 [Blattamonas nauphoetae]
MLALSGTDDAVRAVFVVCSDLHGLYRILRDAISKWKKEGPAVQKRGQQILTKLSEEGIVNETELHFHMDRDLRRI